MTKKIIKKIELIMGRLEDITINLIMDLTLLML